MDVVQWSERLCKGILSVASRLLCWMARQRYALGSGRRPWGRAGPDGAGRPALLPPSADPVTGLVAPQAALEHDQREGEPRRGAPCDEGGVSPGRPAHELDGEIGDESGRD